MAATVAAALGQACSLQATSASWRLDGELLLAAVTQRRREWLLAHGEAELGLAELTRYQDLLQRRQNGEPMAYILGRRGFLDFELTVTPAVLIPRPETELLVETAVDLTRGRAEEALRVADLGTGSGVIAIALGRRFPHWRIDAIDISTEALAVARGNAERLGADNVEFIEGSWCDGLAQSGYYDAIVANPPYVAAGDPHLSEDGLPFEPLGALAAGPDGLDALRAIIGQAGARLKKASWLLLEHGHDQRAALQALLAAQGYDNIKALQDYSGHDRVIVGQWFGPDRMRE
ncbi:MAG: peptide chain release factor N(5)-glutamine methyltransferase [Pseudohongiellaceae bacterium]